MLKTVAMMVLLLGLCEVYMPHHQKASAQQHTNGTQPVAPTAITINNDNHSKNEQAKEDHVAYWWPEGITAIAIILTLIAISLQTFYTRRAAEATKDAVDVANRSHTLAEKTAKQQLRAYLCISKSLVKFTDDGCLEAQLHLKNDGQTPAYKVEGWSHGFFGPHPISYPLPGPTTDILMSSSIISPGDHRILIAEKVPSTDILLKAIETKTYAYCCYGRISYTDIFKDTHVLEYRLIFGGPAKVRTFLDKNKIKCGRLCMDIAGNYEWDKEPEPDQQNPN